uniref:Uncharacterized protein n=1 Tax=Candidatus Kentrum sp. TUN TaxID=2126343 RepID=A0A451A5P3_9GAMM|nr:MAG: hypothetical protein BECKTUN1418F_GA0071002_11648 [Candidatus Kentron sp. TUN]VFK61362.1 MAG: hypothetical protein BECKTUN1418D_GA0071000_11502 [Candidatus Kentron sp. TUN]VFK67806.1 MAG: hypothetical protein BECKTUN1418E_GA0071001_11598 [Candidatus Kentron sp. TUN]
MENPWWAMENGQEFMEEPSEATPQTNEICSISTTPLKTLISQSRCK